MDEDFDDFINDEQFLDEEEIILDDDKEVKVEREREIKTTLPVMSIYEKINIISKRIQQIDNGYKTTMPEEVRRLNLSKSMDIAELEFNNKKLPPLFIIRNFPDGSYEKWSIEEFEIIPIRETIS